MRTLTMNAEVLAALLAATAMAENHYNEAEQIAVRDIAEALDIAELPTLVEREIPRVQMLEGRQLAEYLEAVGQQVPIDEAAYVMEAVMHVVLADKQFAYTEASNMLIIADAIRFEHSLVLLMLADAMKESGEIVVTVAE